jgi:hypothetical protein
MLPPSLKMSLKMSLNARGGVLTPHMGRYVRPTPPDLHPYQFDGPTTYLICKLGHINYGYLSVSLGYAGAKFGWFGPRGG